MKSEDPVLFVHAVIGYAAHGWWLVVIFVVPLVCIWYLLRAFDKRKREYENYVCPLQEYVLRQCERWMHVIIRVQSTIIGMASMGLLLFWVGQITKYYGSDPRPLPEPVEKLEAVFIVGLFSMKLRGIWDAFMVHRWMKEHKI